MRFEIELEKGFGGAPKSSAGGSVIRLKTVALPNEHGGWGITLGPLALGLLVAPSLAHALAHAVVVALAAHGFLPWLAVAVTAALFARAAYGFARRWPSTAERVGFAEMAFGALTVAAAAAGVAFGI